MSNRWVNPSLRPRPPEKPETYSGDSRPIWGLRKQHHQTEPTRERILQNMHSMIQRRRISKGNCLWKNTTTRPVCGCLKSSKTQWRKSVTPTRLTRVILWDVRLLNPCSPTSRRPRTRMGSSCSSNHHRINRDGIAPPSEKTLYLPSTGSFCGFIGKSGKR